ncbi:MAG: cyclase family protein [Gammaproteobacteria bacterium]
MLSACSSNTVPPLWQNYEDVFKTAKYVDLTHAITPTIPVWSGFGASRFGRTVNPQNGEPYSYRKDGFEAGSYDLSTDQLGTQLDPPAHWNPYFPAIDELPPTFAIRPLAVISIAAQVKTDPAYHLSVADILAWEKRNGKIPQGSVVFVRSDWSKDWPAADLATRKKFPGVKLEALKFLHEQRHILFHGHEPLDTDTTPTLEGEAWLLRNGYTQAEGLANLDKVPESGALVIIGYPKFKGGLGGYARFIAVCPADWPFGVSGGEINEAPLARFAKPLEWNEKSGMRMR